MLYFTYIDLKLYNNCITILLYVYIYICKYLKIYIDKIKKLRKYKKYPYILYMYIFYIFLIIIIILLFLFWYYNKCKKIKLNKTINAIKNQITITLDNMNIFVNNSKSTRQILLNIAKKYNNDDIIILLSKLNK